jgi:rod shape determining protein RodA
MSGSGYNTNQSEIAIGSGGWLGKDSSRHTNQRRLCSRTAHRLYLYYSRRRMGFCWFLSCNGAICRIVAQNNLLSRTTKQNSVGFMVTVLQNFIYHFFVNIAMVSGIFPTIGVPLPFSLTEVWTLGLYNFTIYFLSMDANKVNEW